MPKHILPHDSLTPSEKLLVLGIKCTLPAIGLVVVGALMLSPWVVGGVLAILIGLDVRARRRLPRPPSGVHGTAHFASHDELGAAGLTGRTDGLIMGIVPYQPSRDRVPEVFRILNTRMHSINRLRSLLVRLVLSWGTPIHSAIRCLVRIPSSDQKAHTAVFLPTGVGKTFRLIIPNLRTCNENAVVYDPSGQTVLETAEYRRKHFGHEIRVIDPFGVCGGRYTDRLNPLDLVSPNDPACFEYCNHLAHALVIEKDEAHHDPFWHAGTVSATAFLLHTIMLMGVEGMRNLVSLGELLSAEQFQSLGKSYSEHPDTALRRRAKQLLNYQGKTLQSLLACLTAEHGWMDTPAFADILSASTFSVRSLYQRKMTIYVVVPGHRAVESQPFVRTLLTTLLFAGFEAGADLRRPPVRYFLDEAATLGQLDLLMTLWTQGRKYSLRSVNFFQNVAQVAEVTGSPEKIQTFRANMTGGELLKAHDYATAKEISDWIGNTTVRTESTSWQEGANGGWSNSDGIHPSNGRSGGWSNGSTTTISETGVLAIRPEEVLQLGPREAIFVAPGVPPVRLNILDGTDVQRFASSEASARNLKGYLIRVRFRALGFLLLAPSCFALGLGMTLAAQKLWSGQKEPVPQVEQVEWFVEQQEPGPGRSRQQIPSRHSKFHGHRSK